MCEIRIETTITAPPERCFDLARSVEAHVHSAKSSNERAIAGRTFGLLSMGDEVTWEARHFGFTQRLTSQITAFDRPRFFQDRMLRGAFAALEHDHHFSADASGVTRMTDVLRFSAPFGLLGWIVERAILNAHLRRFLVDRGTALKALAESGEWMRYCPES